ncbi:hypothetical protein J41TS12_17510 [Paenibacillus antibioticophila]|uniref:Uncharacterized protein n=1 Tax=Paenibacillus antibioticophila TaxID=1274374 RepID=A0A919XUZ8_9BACL|nr:hypothetical protein [Paenibacillus antibioticophila]GIO36890.1 hypothetical protein J41TS12_17510 [Paenibacillus antibioticophila]
MNYTEMNIPQEDHPSSYALLHYNDGDKETQAEYISNQEEAELRYDAEKIIFH